MQTWEQANKWEREWHGSCANSYNEETKQYIYARYMGLDHYAFNYYGQRGWNFGSKSILDIGGGPYSILLKSKSTGSLAVVDPCPYPSWVKMRYQQCGILFLNIMAEKLTPPLYDVDEILIYNCLQHTEDPELIIKNALKFAKIVRIFEWIDEPVSPGHLHMLTEENLNAWLCGEGRVKQLNEGPCVGKAFFGIFKGIQ